MPDKVRHEMRGLRPAGPHRVRSNVVADPVAYEGQPVVAERIIDRIVRVLRRAAAEWIGELPLQDIAVGGKLLRLLADGEDDLAKIVPGDPFADQ